MSDKPLLADPTNRVVCVFDAADDAAAARDELSGEDYTETPIRLLHGLEAANNIDASPKWFADTDVEIKRYKRELEAGSTVLSIPITDSKAREKVHDVVTRHNARLVTHFGKWITEMMR